MNQRIRTALTVTAAGTAAALALWGFLAIASPAEPVISSAAQQSRIEDQRAEDTYRQLEVTETANAKAAEEARVAKEARVAAEAAAAEAARVAAESEAARLAAEAAARSAAEQQAAADATARRDAAQPAPSDGWSTGNLDGGDAGKQEVAQNCGAAGANYDPVTGITTCAG